MIDVTQHIVDEELFTSAMLNVKRMLNKEAIFIVTEWLSTERKQRRFYETERPLSIYQKKFQGYIFSEPTKFRDKYIFSIHKPKKA
jgi:ribosomal protein S21